MNFSWKKEENPYGSEQLCSAAGLQGVWQRGSERQSMLQLQCCCAFSFLWIYHPHQSLIVLFLLRLACCISD